MTPPSFRPDATIEVDIVEEVARHHGYARIPRTVPHSPIVGHLTPYQATAATCATILAGAGVDEAQAPSLLGPGDHERAGLVQDEPIVAANPMIQEESVLRTSLLPGLLRALAFNAARRSPEVAFFEIGEVFHRPSPERQVEGRDAMLPDERERLAVALGGDAVDAKHLLDTLIEGLRLVDVTLEATTAEGLHPGRTAEIRCSGDRRSASSARSTPASAPRGPSRDGSAGSTSTSEPLLTAPRRSLEQLPVSRFPSSDIDLAFVVPDDVPAATGRAGAPRGRWRPARLASSSSTSTGAPGVAEGSRSLAYRLRFCALDRTLTDADVAEVRARAIEAVVAATGGALRG